MKRATAFATLAFAAIMPAQSAAAPLTLVYDFGVVDLACTSEGAACAPDVLSGGAPSVVGNIFTNVFNGGYRAGGRVVWDFFFDDSPFSSIVSMILQIDVVGLWQNYPGNIDPSLGQIGNYFAIDGVPIYPFVTNTDGRDTYVFAIPILSAGAHQFSVQAYDPAFSQGGNLEGWGGVDFARLTVNGADAQNGTVPEPASLLLSAMALAAALRRRRCA